MSWVEGLFLAFWTLALESHCAAPQVKFYAKLMTMAGPLGTGQILAQWRHPVASRVALDLPYIEKYTQHCTSGPPKPWKWPANEVHFLSSSILSLSITVLNNHVKVDWIWKRVTPLLISMFIASLYYMGAQRRQWMPFWPTLLMAVNVVSHITVLDTRVWRTSCWEKGWRLETGCVLRNSCWDSIKSWS